MLRRMGTILESSSTQGTGVSAKKVGQKRTHEGDLKEDLHGKWVRKELVKIPVAKLRFDDS